LTGSPVARIVRLAMHGLLIVLASLPGLLAVRPAAAPVAPASALAVPAATVAPAAPVNRLAAAGVTASPVVPGPVPPRFGLVKPAPMASWIPNGQVNALATDGTYVYLGGSFTAMTDPRTGLSQAHAGLARVNLTTGASDSTWNPSVTGTVDALALRTNSNTLYVGGLFTAVNGQARSNLAAVSTTGAGAVGAMDPAPNDEVHALLLDGGKLVVGGVFTTITGAAQHRLARLDATTGALDTGFTPNVSGGAVLTVIRPPGSSVYALGGGFTMIGNNPHSFLGLVGVSTGAVNAWVPSSVCPTGIKCQALSVASDGVRIYAAIGGPGGQTAAYDLATGHRDWVVVADGNAQAVVLYGSELYVGGHFNTSFGGRLRRTLAAVDARTGALDPTFHPSAVQAFPGTEAMLATPVGVVAGGAQLSIGGTAQSRLAIFPAAPQNPAAKRVIGGTRVSNGVLPRSLR
jgi:Domain of unknown function (DUF5122) beta-propeller